MCSYGGKLGVFEYEVDVGVVKFVVVVEYDLGLFVLGCWWDVEVCVGGIDLGDVCRVGDKFIVKGECVKFGFYCVCE